MSRQTNNRSLGNRVIGNYVLGKNLGQGTFGKVKIGTHTLTGQQVAIKILDKNKILTAADVERVNRQIHILKVVRHPHIVQLYQIIQTPKQLYLIMEYVSEGQLFNYIVKRKRLKQTEACDFFRQLISGVQYLHQIGVSHRDLKPQNLLIDFNRKLKIVDFGLSNTYQEKQLLKTACGSPCYASPEMIAGKKYIGFNADLWSCGIILFAMICGYLPFEDPNTSLLYKKILSGQFIIPKWVSSDAKDLLQRILNTNPQQRLTLQQIKNHPWYKQIGDESSLFSNGIIINKNIIPIDQNVIQCLHNYQLDPNEVRRHVSNNRHNHSATIYYLLLKKRFKEGINSIYDICSPVFDKNLIKPNQVTLMRNTIVTQQKNKSPSTRVTTAAVGMRSVSRKHQRFSHLSQNNNYLPNKKNNSIQLKLQMSNLPAVDVIPHKTDIRHKFNTINFEKKQKHNQMLNTFYQINQITNFNPYGTPSTHRHIGSFKNTMNKSVNVEEKRWDDNKWDDKKWDRYQNSQQKSLMARTFMGTIPKGYIPRWQDQSQRLRGILNTTISGHSKKRAQKLRAYF